MQPSEIILPTQTDHLNLLIGMLPMLKHGTEKQRDTIERILALTPIAGKIAPVETIEALSKSVLWIGNEYIPHFGHAVLLLRKPALQANPRHALAALEQTLLVCYSALLPKNIYGVGGCNDSCLEWQRQIFFSIIETIEHNPDIDPSAVLKISEIMAGMNDGLRDIHHRFMQIMHHREDEPAYALAGH